MELLLELGGAGVVLLIMCLVVREGGPWLADPWV